ncbi:DUF637 domain-containing protein [Pandoraea pnomenusa]|uniref:DUF637 domain-containing protein n=1 Tax=Pandoraea pnomenusa TaxID=93220 RepID=UPI00215BD39D|nr:DUF637 domain-containing protein [Pandoraea pnomenusa]
MFESDKRHDVWSCGSAAECTSLYGDAYTSVGGVINPPTPVGNIAATIQAPNLTVTSGGQIVNVGNVVGQSVSLTGTSLINGITTANTYTPQVGNAPQVISLAPANGGLDLTIPASLGGAGSSILTGTTGQQNGPSYVVGGLGATLDPVSPQVLISNLPASLQPSTTTFYFSPQQEAIQLQQAALMQTGKASFINGLSTDSTSQLTVNDQQKLVLYGNAVEYAKANNIQLGQALTPEQVAGLSQPMLWYVEQTVPEPGCAATGNAKCPTVTALMPQVYLPENFTALSAGGQILASNDLSLNFGSTATGGSILNTGSITSGGTLTVNTGTLTNRANVVDVGEIWSYIKDAGYLKTTGTMVQPGGFMSAAAGGLTLNVDQFNQIGGALQLLDPNGQVDQAATQAFIAGVSAQLGDNFLQQALKDDLHTDFVKQGGDFGIQQVGMIVSAVALSMVAGPMFSALIGNMAGATAGTATLMAAAGTTAEGVAIGAGLGNIALSAAMTAMTSSAFSQLVMTGSIDFGSVMTSGMSSAITAGLLNGITYSNEYGLGFVDVGGAGNSLSSLAGVNPSYVAGTASNAVATTADKLLSQGVAILAQSAIQAGVQSTIQGGSFLDALKASGINNLGAALAFQIGDLGTDRLGALGYLGAHAALGCAGSAALGTGCAGGAIGASMSAAFAPSLVNAMRSGDESETARRAALSILAGLAGAFSAGGAGADANAGAFWAQNEALNNADQHKGAKGLVEQLLDGITTLSDVRARIGQEFLLVHQKQFGGQPPADPNPLTDANDGPPRGGAASVPISVLIPCLTPLGPVVCGVVTTTVQGASGGNLPSNVYASSGSESGGEKGTSGKGNTPSGYDDVFGGRTTLENVTSRGTRIESIPNGNDATALADFKDLKPKNVRIVSTARGDLSTGLLDDGGTVILRPSKDGRTTIEFQNSSGRTTREIRYGSN